MTWSSQSRVARMVESLRVIGFTSSGQCRVIQISNFSYIFLAIGPPMDLQWLMAIGPPVDLQWLLAIGPPVDLQWL